MAALRREGWAGVRSLPGDPAGSGAFTTQALTVPHPGQACGAPSAQLWLLLNARTAVAGLVSVALLAADGRTPLPGFATPVPFTGDAVRVPAGWGADGNITHDLSALAGASIVVRVDLVHAELFAWEVQCVVV